MAPRVCLAVLLACAGLVSCVQGVDNFGVKSVITLKGCEYLESVALPIVVASIKNLGLSSRSGEKDEMDWKLTNLNIASMSYTGATVALTDGKLSMTVSGVGLSMSGDWSAKFKHWPHVPDGSGSVDVAVGSSSATISLSVGMAHGHPTLQVDTVAVSLESFHLTFHGSAWDWLIDVFKDLFSSDIKSEAQGLLESQLSSLINSFADSALQSIPVTYPLGNGTEVDFALVDAPSIAGGALQAFLMGEVVLASAPAPSSLPHASIPAEECPEMLGFYVDQVLFNSGLQLWTDQGLLVDTLEAVAGQPITTNTFREAIPPLWARYPNRSLHLRMAAQPTSVPSVTISPGAASLHLALNVSWMAQAAPGGNTYAFAFATTFSFAFDMSFAMADAKQPALVGNVSLTSTAVALGPSSIGTFSVAPLKGLVAGLFGPLLVDELNAALRQGLPLPVVDGLSFDQPSLELRDGYLFISTNLAYKVPDSLVHNL